MRSNVLIRYVYEINQGDKKIKTTEEMTCYLGLNKIGDVWFCIDEISKTSIKIRVGLLEELVNTNDNNHKNHIAYFNESKKILKWELPITLKKINLKIGKWANFFDGDNSRTNYIYVKKINYNAIK